MSVLAVSLLQMGVLAAECVECHVELVYAPEFRRKLTELGLPVQVPASVTRLVIAKMVFPPLQLQTLTQHLDARFAQAQQFLVLVEGGRFYVDAVDATTLALYVLQSVTMLGLEGAELRRRRRHRNRSRGRGHQPLATRRAEKQAQLDAALHCGDYERAAVLRDEIRGLDAPSPPAADEAAK